MLKRTLLLSLVTLLLLELVLQVGSAIVWAGHRETPPQQARNVEKTVLCIGDSFTFGMGSSRREFSYPAQLEVMLREQLDPSWRVVNAGFPGRNSRELLERISDQLATYEPQFVYVMIGINDIWTAPDLLDLTAAGKEGSIGLAANSFRWELRSLRMLRWISGGMLSDDTPSSAEPSTPMTAPNKATQIPAVLVDTWVHPNFSLTIEKDGRVALAGAALTSSASGDTLALHWPSGESLKLRWHLQSGKLHLRGAGWTETIELQCKTRTPRKLASKAGSAEAAKDYQNAAELYQLAIATAPETAVANWYARLVDCLTRLARTDEAIDLIAVIRTRNDQANEASWATALSSSLSVVGHREECMVATEAALERFPDNPYLLQIYGWELFQGGEREQSLQAMARAVHLADSLNNWFGGFARERLVTMLRSNQPRKAIEVIAELYRLKDSHVRVISCIINAKRYLDLDLVEETLQAIDLTAAERKDLLGIFEATYSPNDAPYEIIEAHLEQVVRLIQQNGATAVLSSYPWHNAQISAIHDRLERHTSAGRMDMSAAFRKALVTAPRSRLFAPDGHCHDGGYGLMAEQVFKDLRQRLAH